MLRVICVLAELSGRRHCTFWWLCVNEHVRYVVKKISREAEVINLGIMPRGDSFVRLICGT